MLILKSGKVLELGLTFTKIKSNPDRPTLFTNPWLGNNKQAIFQVQPGLFFFLELIYEHLMTNDI